MLFVYSWVRLGWSIQAFWRSTEADSDVLGAIFGKGRTDSSHLTSSLQNWLITNNELLDPVLIFRSVLTTVLFCWESSRAIEWEVTQSLTFNFSQEMQLYLILESNSQSSLKLYILDISYMNSMHSLLERMHLFTNKCYRCTLGIHL